MKNKRVILSLFLMVAQHAMATELVPMNDESLAEISAREGIALNFEMLINATLDSNGELTPEHCPDATQVASGTADCRFALQFNSIDDAWLVVKEYYGVFRLNEVRVDGVRTPSNASGYCDSDCQGRFGPGFDPDDRPAIQLGYDHDDLGENEAFYGDASLFLNAGKVVAEFNQKDGGGSIVTPGYLRNETPGAAIGLRMADGPNASGGSAQIRFDGNMMMYGY